MVAKVNRLIFSFILILWICAVCFSKHAAAGQDLTLISDAQTQNYLAAIVGPLFRAAGITFDPKRLLIVNDPSLNAFVSDGNYLFVHTGTIIQAKNTNELAGVLAHETGHIMGGHIVRQKLKMEKMQYVMLASMLAAGATAVSTGRGDAAMAVILGSQSSAVNSMLHYQIQEERSADESAVKLLSKTKQSTVGLLNFMRKIKRNNTLSGIEENSYFSTHPLTNERISHFIEAGEHNHFSEQNSLDKELLMIQAKLSAFLEDKSKVDRKYPLSRATAEVKYAQSILMFRQGNIKQALTLIDELIKSQVENPYFYELKGQFLFESGRVNDSVAAYRKALELLPNNDLLQFSLAHAIIENKPSKTDLKEAVRLLEKSLISFDSVEVWQLLARAYDMLGDKAHAHYATAEFNYGTDHLEAADKQLDRALEVSKDMTLNRKIADLKDRIKEDLKEKQQGILR